MSAAGVMRFVDPTQDPWKAPAEAVSLPKAYALLSLDQWTDLRGLWPAAVPVGVVLANTVDVQALVSELPRWSLVALQFPKWTDGRAYSQARLLRARLRFKGEVRATGEVVADMLPLLQRSGFDAALMRPDQSLDAARRALRFFASHYQGDVIQSRPLFTRIEA